MFVDAEAARYGVSVRLLGMVSADATTGKLTTAVLENPPLPFSDFVLHFNPGAHAALANPLVCGAATTNAIFTPYTGNPAASPFMSFPVDFNGKGASCPSPLPFALSQSTEAHPTTGGAASSFTLSLARSDGQQYLSKVSTTLPEGVVGIIPSVTLCGEPQAEKGECGPASQIGTVSVSVGAGTSPFGLTGTVYLTGPYAGAPYGLSVVVPAEKVGPFNYGKIVTRATININPFSARVTLASSLPTIVGGVPLRLRTISISANRPNFMLNPTNCGVLATETLLTSTFGATNSLSTPFQASGCSALAFHPTFSASTAAKSSKSIGASLKVKVGYPTGPQANIKSVLTQLPKQLVSRLSTLNKACPEATFNANPFACPTGSRVGGATATTPVLSNKLTGPAFFVSHGGAAFPDLDLVMTGGGVEIILVGNTNITNGITTTNFAATPDVPVSGFELKLPLGAFSALTANGRNLCGQRLIMPTTITAQNGAVIKQNVHINVTGCGVRILSQRVRHGRLLLGVEVPSAGRVSGSGRYLRFTIRHARKAGRITIAVPFSRTGLRELARHRHARIRARVGFVPNKGRVSIAFATVTLK